jgi:hypothetical protein
MEAGYITALAALGGAALGGFTSFATSWTTLRAQMKAESSSSSKSRRRRLYRNFINHASQLYGDSLVHDKLELSGMIDLHALISRMRILSSAPVIDHAVKVARTITDTYLEPNKTPIEIKAMIDDGTVDLLKGFSEACRVELETSGEAL